MVQDLDMACFTYSGYGKKFIKSQRMSPDSYIQMAIQLAFYRWVQSHIKPAGHELMRCGC